MSFPLRRFLLVSLLSLCTSVFLLFTGRSPRARARGRIVAPLGRLFLSPLSFPLPVLPVAFRRPGKPCGLLNNREIRINKTATSYTYCLLQRSVYGIMGSLIRTSLTSVFSGLSLWRARRSGDLPFLPSSARAAGGLCCFSFNTTGDLLSDRTKRHACSHDMLLLEQINPPIRTQNTTALRCNVQNVCF